ncbi:MAG: hypothetical protein H7274_23800, partial [Rhodoferax sp.]|nr:hypothetical protein [Rhodoferax sp.]
METDEEILRTARFDEGSAIVDYCLWDGDGRNIPSRDELLAWRAIFVGRGSEFAEVVADCDDYL